MAKFKFRKTKPVLQDKEVLDCLNDLHESVLVFPIDKTSNTVDIIPKKAYIQKRLLEVGTNSSESNIYLLPN